MTQLFSETFHRVVVFLLLLASFAACGPRQSGLSEDEFGKTFFWRVIEDVVLDFENCTDLDSFRDDIETPVVEENSFVIYKVNTDGEGATSQECDELSTASCREGEVVYTRAENVFEAVVDLPAIDFAGACDASRRQILRLTDEGEALSFSLELQLGLEGPEQACAALEEQIRDESPNGLGIESCVVKLSTVAVFERSLD